MDTSFSASPSTTHTRDMRTSSGVSPSEPRHSEIALDVSVATTMSFWSRLSSEHPSSTRAGKRQTERRKLKVRQRTKGRERDRKHKPGRRGQKEKKAKKKKKVVGNDVSRNISMVLENLLQNYENSRPPAAGQGKPTVVQTNILIRSMGPVSELDMDYSMDCYFRQKWRDPRLSFQGPIKSLSLSIKMLERIWRPDTYFYNGKQSYVHTITVPNKLLRLSREGDILYSMRLTIKAKCPMELHNFPMDEQSCPLVLGSYAYPRDLLVYEWQGGPHGTSVEFIPGMALSQFDLMGAPHRNITLTRRDGDFSVLQVSFNLRRNTGYFLIQVYVPCILIVVLSWVSFWIHREATSDRIGLGITTVLTLSTISLDSRTDLPKVRYATALDWFLLMSFLYCVATLLQFAGVHFFTKVGSGEVYVDEDEWVGNWEEQTVEVFPRRVRRRSSLICPIINDPSSGPGRRSSRSSRIETPPPPPRPRPPRARRWKQLLLCLMGDEEFRRQRQRAAQPRHVNSVSGIDRAARILFPASFGVLNTAYWVAYASSKEDFSWKDPPLFLDH